MSDRQLVFDDEVPGPEMETPAGSALSTGQAGAVELEDPGLAVPVTPPRDFVEIGDSPRASASARPRHMMKRQQRSRKTEDAKRQRINRLEHEKRVSEIKLAYKEFLQLMTPQRI